MEQSPALLAASVAERAAPHVGVFSAGQSNGRITQSIDSIANQTVNYGYDPSTA